MAREKGKNAVINLNEEDENCESFSSSEEEFISSEKIEKNYPVDDMDEEVMNMVFDSEEDAYEFYNLYGKLTGFGIKKADVKISQDGTVRYRKFACSREGKRHERYYNVAQRIRQPRPETRTGCLACLRIKHDKASEKYVVTNFVKEHNHKMASKSSIPYLWSHRHVTDADYAQVRTMKMAGVKTSQVMKFFAMQCGGYGNVGFVLKDLYNRVDEERRVLIEAGDAKNAIAYFNGRKASDKSFIFEYDVDEESRLKTLFWADYESQLDYKCFGDVLIFDSTYNVNEYHKPLVVFSGVNNHYNTVVFGTALVSGESVEEYEWLLHTLTKAMGGRKPKAVITDGDKAMRRAINNVFPDARHRLCSWHLMKNAEAKAKSNVFKSMFGRMMKKAYPIGDLEEEWFAVVGKCGLRQNKWVEKIFEMRLLWAESLLRDTFFAGMRSTQRCEQMNAFLKQYLKKNMRFYESVIIHELALTHLRHTGAKAVHETEDTIVVLATELQKLEKHASEVYTRNVFFRVKKHLNRQGLYDCYEQKETWNGCVFFLKKYADDRTWTVELNRRTLSLKCSCKKMEWKGLPCAHMFRVMLMENMQSIPKSCILKRWTCEAREEADNEVLEGRQEIYAELVQTARFGTLTSICKEMCFFASHMDDGFARVRDIVIKETNNWRRAWVERGFDCGTNERLAVDPKESRLSQYCVKDPERTRAKGDRVHTNKNKAAKCGNCGLRDGHNKRTCPRNLLSYDACGISGSQAIHYSNPGSRTMGDSRFQFGASSSGDFQGVQHPLLSPSEMLNRVDRDGSGSQKIDHNQSHMMQSPWNEWNGTGSYTIAGVNETCLVDRNSYSASFWKS
ncbi:protein FAR1-RELATED SEQUENCE 5-like [Coffea arabica]|uniref:Protein FAR1-RELATED SEQUENCE 5-like n=1 Tax=Coffea arabica TaxID=13443 RepID=A0ABM4VHK9_COFAR